jgi:hypothetical protein
LELLRELESKKMADGGAIGFEALSEKVASRYEGQKVKPQYQDEYGKTYSAEEAKEVGDKVAAKVYREQQAKMAKGGVMHDDEGVDLFEDYEDQPAEVQAILAKYEIEDNDYNTLKDLQAELEEIGYTIEFGLDAEPFDLRKIGQKGKSDFYAKGGILEQRALKLFNKLKQEGKLKRYIDTRGNGKKYFETIIPNYAENGYWRRFESATSGSIGVLQNEYLDKTINEFTNPEQATFESVWIQREEDAKNLSDWIKNQWSKKQSVCELEIFSNPLISVGDLVTINYPANGFDGTQKFIVSNINNTFEGGLNTKITARSIYSQ